jgi:hypothetical protein
VLLQAVATADRIKFAGFSDVISLLQFGTRWRSWLRHCATNRRTAVSIPGGVTVIFLFCFVITSGKKVLREELIFYLFFLDIMFITVLTTAHNLILC